MKGSTDCVKLLLSKGASLTETDDKGLLMEPIVVGTLSLVSSNNLQICSSKQEYEEKGIDVQVDSVKGLTPLMLACFFGSASCVEYLVKRGASLQVGDLFLGLTPLHAAAYSGSAECVLLLADKIDILLFVKKWRIVSDIS